MTPCVLQFWCCLLVVSMSCLSVLCEVGVTSNTRAPRGRPGRARRASHASPCDGRVVSGDWCVRMSLVSEVRSIAETRRAENAMLNVKGAHYGSLTTLRYLDTSVAAV